MLLTKNKDGVNRVEKEKGAMMPVTMMVILLIILGVSISISASSKGILTRTEEAQEQLNATLKTEQDRINEAEALYQNYMMDYMNSYNFNY